MYFYQYNCRQCGEKFKQEIGGFLQSHMTDSREDINIFELNLLHDNSNKVAIHYHADESIGLADLIGVIKEEKRIAPF